MPITELLMENIRGFSGKHIIPIRPITLLVGENNTGKTTILGALNAFNSIDRNPINPVFNEEPFTFGSFDDIVTKRGGRAGSQKYFALGSKSQPSSGNSITYLYTRFANVDQRVVLEKALIFTSKYIVGIERSKEYRYIISICEAKELPNNISLNLNDMDIVLQAFYNLMKTSKYELSSRRVPHLRDLFIPFNLEEIEKKIPHSILREVDEIFRREIEFGRFFNLAPIRSKPKSTYETYEEQYSPEGDHIPYALMRLLEKGENENLIKILNELGSKSGLFSEIKIKYLNETKSKFELRIKSQGPPRNIPYVGYGISQSLPIAFESLRLLRNSTITIQQPEVHLHPKAQASLASLFVQLAVSDQKTFVIETHSDYIIDRVRIEVAKGNINKDDVVIIYTELQNGLLKAHSIFLNDHGDLLEVPPTYRQFFMQEEYNLLMR